MPHIIKDFIINLKYPLELPTLPEIKRNNQPANWIEALASLNQQMRLMGAKEVILNIDYTTDANLQLMAKRYSNDAVLEYTKGGKRWELISRNFTSLSANVMQLAKYMECVRRAEKLKILCKPLEVQPWKQEPEALTEHDVHMESENDVFDRIKETTFQ